MSIRVLLVDDHKMMRDGLRALLAGVPDIEIVGEASDGRTALDLVRTLAPDVVVMDVSMPDLNGIDATRRILAGGARTKVLALSMHVDRRFVTEMLNAGASGYLLKDCAFEELIHAIRTVAGNSTYLSPRITDIVLQDYVRRGPKNEDSALSVLTVREREVLQLLAEGRRTKEIASLLGVSVKTIETYRQQIMEKLEIRSIAELTKFAVREGLTSP
jgi:DNA-binding NarL/FixJ family response regulator